VEFSPLNSTKQIYAKMTRCIFLPLEHFCTILVVSFTEFPMSNLIHYPFPYPETGPQKKA